MMTVSSTSKPETSVRTVICGNGRIRVLVLAEQERLLLRVVSDEVVVIDRLEFGITVDGERLDGSSTVRGTDRRRITESFQAAVGKVTGERLVDHEETVVTLTTPSGRDWAVIVRTAADGFAFRYQLPADRETLTLGNELTRIGGAASDRAWSLDYQTWYETPRFGSDLGKLQPGDYGFPTLITSEAQTWVLYTESDIDGRSSGAHLKFTRDADEVGFTVVTADEAIEVAPAHVTPWRVGIVGSLAGIVASTLVDDLAPAADPAQVVPTRPGRSAWSWWSSQYSGAYLADQMRFADYAADQGWEHVLVDCGWDAAWMPELVSYASRRGIQVHLWSSWSDLDGEEALRKLALWRSWGVAGIKVDFMESESQERYRWYDAVIAETARVGLMVNFHGSVIPRGWARTHPQVVSYEGVRGAEYYVFYGNPLTAAHNVIQPFTRNVVGSMDYTPVAFSAPERETSDGHELALSVVYESGITHFADDPAHYLERPLGNAFLAEVAPRWDEIRLLGGHPDREAVVARRSGDRWFVGAIATGEARIITFDPLELIGGDFAGWLVGDAGGAVAGLVERNISAADGAIEVPVAVNGGFVAIIAPGTAALRRAKPRETLAPPTLVPSVATLGPAHTAVLTTSADANLRMPPGWRAEQVAPGQWFVTAAPDADPGSVGVVAAELPGLDGTVVVAHARLFLSSEQGEYSLSQLPFLTARNALGPVERDESNGGGDPHDGGVLTVAGTVSARGLGVSDDSSVEFNLGGQGGVLTLGVGVDDATPASSARALILLDGLVAEAIPVRSGEEARPVRLDLRVADVLELRTEPDPDSAIRAHVDWINPTITR